MFSHLMNAEISHRIGRIGLGIAQRLNAYPLIYGDIIKKKKKNGKCDRIELGQTKRPRSMSACAFSPVF